jgi:hypothetical protein
LACNSEFPDVIGFGSWGWSVVIECKVSRSDFFSDQNKLFRKERQEGMGSERFYCCPTGLIKKEELPTAWGLIYVNDKNRATKVYDPWKAPAGSRLPPCLKNLLAEHTLMYSALRRLHLRNRIEEIYLPELITP